MKVHFRLIAMILLIAFAAAGIVACSGGGSQISNGNNDGPGDNGNNDGPGDGGGITVERDDPTVKSVALFVDASFYENGLISRIDRLAADIENDLSVDTFIITVDVGETRPEAIREQMVSLYQESGLIGSLLIGDIPAVYFGDLTYPGEKRTLTDSFYEDLHDITWEDPERNGIYNIVLDEDGDGVDDIILTTYTGIHNREIWAGRLTPPRSGYLSHAERVEMVNRYLDRNHLYRTGQLSYQRGMVYCDSVGHNNNDTTDYEEDYETMFHRAFVIFSESWLHNQAAGDQLNFIWDDDIALHRNLWLAGAGENYDYGYLNVHGSTNGQWFGESLWLYPQDYQASPVNSMFVELASCNNGDFNASNYLAGWVLFGGNALAVTANTTEVWQAINQPAPNPALRLLSLGVPLGELRLAYVLSNDSGVFLGDPTLRLRQPAEGPLITVNESGVIRLPTESASELSKGAALGGAFSITNEGDVPVDVHYYISTMTSINGRRPLGNDFQCSIGVPLAYTEQPITLLPGQSQSIPLSFYYDGQSGRGKYESRILFYTNSSKTPYFWIKIEKELTA